MKVDSVSNDMAALRSESREVAMTVAKLEALGAKKEDFSELRERIAGVEPFFEQARHLKLF